MTKDEFKALKKHARVKYVGTTPERFFSHGVGCTQGTGGACNYNCQAMPKNFTTKGVVVMYASEDTWSSSATKGQLTMYYYGGVIHKVVPEEWNLVDARAWVEGETEFKRAKSYIPGAVTRFKDDLKTYLNDYKKRVEYKVDDLPLDKKLKIIMELSPEDRKWFGIMTTSPEDTLATIEKAFDEDPI